MGATSYFGSIIYILNRHDSGISKGVLIGLSALFILLISTSRVYLGVHYPTDIISGIIGGAFVLYYRHLSKETTRHIKPCTTNIDPTTEMILKKKISVVFVLMRIYLCLLNVL